MSETPTGDDSFEANQPRGANPMTTPAPAEAAQRLAGMRVSPRPDPLQMNIAICAALGLDAHSLQSLTLRLRRDALPTVEAVSRVREGDELVDVLSRYELIEKPTAEETE